MWCLQKTNSFHTPVAICLLWPICVDCHNVWLYCVTCVSRCHLYIYIYIYMMCDCIWLFQSPHTQLRIGDNFCVMLRPDVITCGHILSLCIDSRNDWATRKEMWKNEQWPKLNPKSVIDQLQVWVQDLEPDIVCDSTNGTWSECRWMEMNP